MKATMKATILIIYDYDEDAGMLPSGLPASPPYCHKECPHLNPTGACELFCVTLTPAKIGTPPREVFRPAYGCQRHEIQGR